jgi:aspartate kinase
VSYKREVTTLGRGGSDTTAVALAAALDAEACEIYSDVAGVYTADPRVVPDVRRLAELSYEEMQELAESGARVLNAQAIEFAKERGIALYARATAGGPGETVVRRLPPRAPGRVVGVASEKGLVLATLARAGAVDALLAFCDESGVCGKELLVRHGPAGETGSMVISLENIHGFPAFRQALGERFASDATLREGVGAVSLIGAGINQTFHNWRRASAIVDGLGCPRWGASTSSFRISFLLPEDHVDAAVRALHEGLVTEGRTEPSPTD